MKRGTKRSRLLPFTISAILLAAAAALSSGILVSVQAAPTPGYKLSTVGAYGGEPSIASDSLGRLYDTTPSGGTLTYTSANHGSTWSQVTTADPNSGDDCLATDQANSVYLCNLAGSEGVAPLQADVWKTVNHGSTWTSLWATTPANRPQLAAASNNGSTTSFDTTALAAGDWLRIDVAQVGSTVAGSGVVAVLATT